MRISLTCEEDYPPLLEIHQPTPSVQDLLDNSISPSIHRENNIYYLSISIDRLGLVNELFKDLTGNSVKFRETLRLILL